MKKYIETPRLILRDWNNKNIFLLICMNRDTNVMELFPKPLTENESIQFFDRIVKEIKTERFGLYAVERKYDKVFIGYNGFHRIGFYSDFTPGIEIGWRLIRDAWEKGYATDAAKGCLEKTEQLGVSKCILSFRSLINDRNVSCKK